MVALLLDAVRLTADVTLDDREGTPGAADLFGPDAEQGEDDKALEAVEDAEEETEGEGGVAHG